MGVLLRGVDRLIIGMAILIYLMVQASKGRYTSAYNTPVELFGLYWHFVDIVWLLLFSLVYLI